MGVTGKRVEKLGIGSRARTMAGCGGPKPKHGWKKAARQVGLLSLANTSSTSCVLGADRSRGFG